MTFINQVLPDQFTAFTTAATMSVEQACIFGHDIHCFMRDGEFVIVHDKWETIYDPERFEDICQLQIDAHNILKLPIKEMTA